MKIDSVQRRIHTLEQLILELTEQIDETRSTLGDLHIETIEEKDKGYIDRFIKPREMDPKERRRYIKFLLKHYDKKYLKSVYPLIKQLPESNGSRFYKKMNVNIGIIADEFLFNSYKGVANFYYITGSNYEELVEELDVFLVSTTWKGLNREWKGLGNPNIRKPRNELFEIIDFYQSKGIKTVFYSKEDPVNYEIFIEIAKKCEYIFTTAAEKIDSYKKECQHANVFLLPFGVNPLLHNPIGFRKFPKEKDVVFAGSWYNKYFERQKDTRMVFDGVVDSGYKLRIIDRNFHLKLEQYFFPKEYVKFLSPSLQHEDLQKFHKLQNWSMNLNSVKYSPTMFANRVYELQALGNIILSNYNAGINNQFPNISIVHNSAEVNDILNSFNNQEIYQQQVYGIRKVMSKHTTFQRLQHLLAMIGHSFEKKDRWVAIVVNEMNENIMDSFNKQTYPYKQLVLKESLNEQIKSSFDMITFFNDQTDYGEFYLEDMVNAFKYTDSDYITKDSFYDGDKFIKGIEFDYVDKVKDKERTVFWSSSFSCNQLLSLEKNSSIPNGFSIDPFEYNQKKMIREEKAVKKYKVSIIVPVFNNGDHLLNKCFNSLKRSRMFQDMEIIIVDDGSTDQYTPIIIRRLASQYSNVKVYFFPIGGSGSASRPRNKGVELATAPYVTYLDPDNEAINDGYYYLYKEMKAKKYDFVVGNMIKVAEDTSHFDYYKTVINYNQKDVIHDQMSQYLINSQFKAMSIQALMVKRQLILDHSLQMVNGATGQDTLFFQELLLHAKTVKAINRDIHVYYGAVEGSIVNSISKKFLEKHFLLEKQRISVYKKFNILDEYIERRFEYYFKNWYLKKLKKIKKSELKDAIHILRDIYALYEEKFEPKDIDVIRFLSLSKQERYEDIWKEMIVN